jgi:hypothetical protein
MDPETAERLSLLQGSHPHSRPGGLGVGQQPVDWEVILRMADQHRVLPLLQRHLRALQPGSVPPAVLEQLQQRCRVFVRANLHLVGQLLAILKLLERHGITAIPFKGAVLATAVYGNLSLRPPGDLDILVYRDDLRRAADVLAALGYRPWSATEGEGTLPARLIHHEYRFRHPEHGTLVELRWRVMQPLFSSSIAIEDLWQRREEIVLASGTVPSLAPEDLLLILCEHGSKHQWSRLVWICDVAELLRARPDIDWSMVQKRAGEIGITRALALGLRLADELLGAAMPPPIQKWARDVPCSRSLMGTVCDRLFRPSTGASEPATDGTGLLSYKLRLAPRPSERGRCALFLARRLFNPKEGDRTMLRPPAGLGLLCSSVRALHRLGSRALAPLGRGPSPARPTPDSPLIRDMDLRIDRGSKCRTFVSGGNSRSPDEDW